MNLPERIYLQWEPDAVEVTWCEDRINDSDVEYVLVRPNRSWCVICREFVEGSVVASFEVGGWYCGRHTAEEIQKYKDEMEIT